jgi:hypothetical protein
MRETAVTLRIEKDIIETLKEMIEALKKARKQSGWSEKAMAILQRNERARWKTSDGGWSYPGCQSSINGIVLFVPATGRRAAKGESRSCTWVDRKQVKGTVIGRAQVRVP